MIAYQYQHGDRPLEGYTIQSAAGRGGFGEVYYAISDSGREVALKTLTAYEQIELRGISQCMNLKSPHLVTIFDVKYNAQGRPFVIMEYVSGPNLRQLLDENPSGLGEQKSAFFLREIGKGLSFLHDCGIVHRDLKPANIFYENGYVKIGDYGLSKAISTSQHSGQTITVGTVHYMAPEIGAGKYDRSIDIYALGAVLYEMMTGVPPYVGASPSEILLKHLSAQPDCKGIPEPFGTVICRAMAKDPNERYQTVQEMVEAIFGAEHVRQSVSVFSPQELSMVAGRVAQNAGIGGGTAAPPKPPPLPQSSDPWTRIGERFGDAAAKMADQMTGKWRPGNRGEKSTPDLSRDFTVPLDDPLPLGSRLTLAILTTLVTAAAGAVFAPRSFASPMVIGFFVASAVIGATAAVWIVRTHFAPRLDRESRGVRRLITAAMAGLGMMIATPLSLGFNQNFGGLWIAVVAAMFLADIESFLQPDRRERVELRQLVKIGFLAFIFSSIFHGSSHLAIAIAAGTGLALQMISPWNPRTSSPQSAAKNSARMKIYGNVTVDQQQAREMQAAGAKVYGNMNVRGDAAASPVAANQPLDEYWQMPVAPAIRYAWLSLLVVMLSLTIGFSVAAVADRNDLPVFASLAAGFLVAFFMCVQRAGCSAYYGIWNYLLRPMLISACIITLIVLGIAIRTTPLVGDELGVAAGFIAFSLIAMIVAIFIPGKHLRNESSGVFPSNLPNNASPQTRTTALILASLWFVGAGGIHRFYVGKIFTGIIWVMTGGLFGIGQLIDVAMILGGNFTDKDGKPLLIWDEAEKRSLVGDMPPQSPPKIAVAPQTFRPRIGSHANGLFSALAGLLLFVGMIVATAIALDLPAAANLGVFGPQVTSNLQQNIFNGYPQWPVLAHKVGLVVMGLAFLAAVVAMLFARSSGGVAYQIRGAIGVAGLLALTTIVHGAFAASAAWPEISPLVAQRKFPVAVDTFLNHWAGDQVFAAGLVLLVSIVLLAWPPRMHRER